MHLIILTVLTGLFALMAYVFYDVGREDDSFSLMLLGFAMVVATIYCGAALLEGLTSSRAHAQCAFCSTQPCFTRDTCGGGACVCLKHGQSQRGECVSLE